MNSGNLERNTGEDPQRSYEGGVPDEIATGVQASAIRALRNRPSSAATQPEQGAAYTQPHTGEDDEDPTTAAMPLAPSVPAELVPLGDGDHLPARRTGEEAEADEPAISTRRGTHTPTPRGHSISRRAAASKGPERRSGWTRGRILAAGTAGLVAVGGITTIIADPFAGPTVVTAAEAAAPPRLAFDTELAHGDPVTTVLNERQGLHNEEEVWKAYAPYVVAAANHPLLTAHALPDRQEVRIVLEALTYTPYSGENASPTNPNGPLNMPPKVLDHLLREINEKGTAAYSTTPLELREPNSSAAIRHNLHVYFAAGLFQVETVFPTWAKEHPREPIAAFIDYAFGSDASGKIYEGLASRTDPALQTALANRRLDDNVTATVGGLQEISLISQSAPTNSNS